MFLPLESWYESLLPTLWQNSWTKQHMEGKVNAALCNQEAWQQNKAAGHMVSAVRKQREMNVGPQFALSHFFFKSGTPALMVLATFHVHCPLVGLSCTHLMDTHCFHGWSGWWWRITQSTKVAALLGQDLLTVGGQGQGNTSTDLRSDQQMTLNRPVWKLPGSQ